MEQYITKIFTEDLNGKNFRWIKGTIDIPSLFSAIFNELNDISSQTQLEYLNFIIDNLLSTPININIITNCVFPGKQTNNIQNNFIDLLIDRYITNSWRVCDKETNKKIIEILDIVLNQIDCSKNNWDRIYQTWSAFFFYNDNSDVPVPTAEEFWYDILQLLLSWYGAKVSHNKPKSYFYFSNNAYVNINCLIKIKEGFAWSQSFKIDMDKSMMSRYSQLNAYKCDLLHVTLDSDVNIIVHFDNELTCFVSYYHINNSNNPATKNKKLFQIKANTWVNWSVTCMKKGKKLVMKFNWNKDNVVAIDIDIGNVNINNITNLIIYKNLIGCATSFILYNKAIPNETIVDYNNSYPYGIYKIKQISEFVCKMKDITLGFIPTNIINNEIIDNFIGGACATKWIYDSQIKNCGCVVNNSWHKNINLLGGIKVLLPLGEIMLKVNNHKIFECFVSLVNTILIRKPNNIMNTFRADFFQSISIFIEKFPDSLFTESIWEKYKILVGNWFSYWDKVPLCKTVFDYFLWNRAIIFKFSAENQIKIWDFISNCFYSDDSQIKNFTSINILILFLKYYDHEHNVRYCCNFHFAQYNWYHSTDGDNDICSSNLNLVMAPEWAPRIVKIIQMIKLWIFKDIEWVDKNFAMLMQILNTDMSPCWSNWWIGVFIDYFNSSKINRITKANVLDGLIRNNGFLNIIVFVLSITPYIDCKLNVLKVFSVISSYKDEVDQIMEFFSKNKENVKFINKQLSPFTLKISEDFNDGDEYFSDQDDKLWYSFKKQSIGNAEESTNFVPWNKKKDFFRKGSEDLNNKYSLFNNLTKYSTNMHKNQHKNSVNTAISPPSSKNNKKYRKYATIVTKAPDASSGQRRKGRLPFNTLQIKDKLFNLTPQVNNKLSNKIYMTSLSFSSVNPTKEYYSPQISSSRPFKNFQQIIIMPQINKNDFSFERSRYNTLTPWIYYCSNDNLKTNIEILWTSLQNWLWFPSEKTISNTFVWNFIINLLTKHQIDLSYSNKFFVFLWTILNNEDNCNSLLANSFFYQWIVVILYTCYRDLNKNKTTFTNGWLVHTIIMNNNSSKKKMSRACNLWFTFYFKSKNSCKGDKTTINVWNNFIILLLSDITDDYITTHSNQKRVISDSIVYFSSYCLEFIVCNTNTPNPTIFENLLRIYRQIWDGYQLKTEKQEYKYSKIIKDYITNKGNLDLFVQEINFLNQMTREDLDIPVIKIISFLYTFTIAKTKTTVWIDEYLNYIEFCITASLNMSLYSTDISNSNQKENGNTSNYYFSYEIIQKHFYEVINHSLFFMYEGTETKDDAWKNNYLQGFTRWLSLIWHLLSHMYEVISKKKKKLKLLSMIPIKSKKKKKIDFTKTGVFKLFTGGNLEKWFTKEFLAKFNFSLLLNMVLSNQFKELVFNCEGLRKDYQELNNISEMFIENKNKFINSSYTFNTIYPSNDSNIYDESYWKSKWMLEEDIVKNIAKVEENTRKFWENKHRDYKQCKAWYKTNKKQLFSFNGEWSYRHIFYDNRYFTSNELNNDWRENADDNKSNNTSGSYNNEHNPCWITRVDSSKYKLKWKLWNHYGNLLYKPILFPILDINNYLPDYTYFPKETLFLHWNKVDNNMNANKDIDNNSGNVHLESEPWNKANQVLSIINLNIDSVLNDKDLLQNNTLELFSNFKSEAFNSNSTIWVNILKTFSSTLSKKLNFVEKHINNGTHLPPTNSKIIVGFKCCFLKPSRHIRGFWKPKTNHIEFNIDIYKVHSNKDDNFDKERKTCYGSYFPSSDKELQRGTLILKYSDIKIIFNRKYLYKSRAIEWYTTTNKSFYFIFQTADAKSRVLSQIWSKYNNVNEIKTESSNVIGYIIINDKYMNSSWFAPISPSRSSQSNSHITQQNQNMKQDFLSVKVEEWWNSKISNFEFLLLLNILSNRSFNDISQYPVFPWIITQYSKRVLSIDPYKDEHAEVRDFSLPIGMMELTEKGKKRKEWYIDKYISMKNEIKDNKNNKDVNTDNPFAIKESSWYIYGSHYSNPIYVSHYLTRIFPYSNIMIELQGNKFDDPNRLFKSIEQSFDCAASQEVDVRELCPEFFYWPEMFININELNLGISQNNGEKAQVNNVSIPEWCENNPYEFIIKMKEFLEYPIISKNISKWFDWIFGFKQKGKEAKAYYNLYIPSSYEDFSIDGIAKDQIQYYMQIAEFGLTPHQWFVKELSQKKTKENKQITESAKTSNWKFVTNKTKVYNTSLQMEKIKVLDNERVMGVFSNYSYTLYKYTQSTITSKYNIDTTTRQYTSGNTNNNNIYYWNKLNSYYYPSPIIVYNNGRTIIQGGFYDGKLWVSLITDINSNSSNNVKTMVMYNDYDNNAIVAITQSSNEEIVLCGTWLGSVFWYYTTKDTIWEWISSINDHSKEITSWAINTDLNIWGSSSKDGFVHIYTFPLNKKINSVNWSTVCFFADYLFISSSPLSSFVCYSKTTNCFYSYSWNGFYWSKEEENNGEVVSPIVFQDQSFSDYLVYGTKDGYLCIRKFPDMNLYPVLKISEMAVKCIDISKDRNYCYAWTDEGQEIISIKNPKVMSEAEQIIIWHLSNPFG